MNKREVIVELLAEGGSIALTGVRHDHGWTFSRSIDESTAYDLIGEEPVFKKSAEVDSWEGALRLLDKYPWQTFHPSSVHPEFRERIWIAVQERLAANNESMSKLERWRNLCT
jgi:hypothetical protein